MRAPRGRTPEASWQPYLVARALHLVRVPPAVCAFCRTRTHLPSRQGWWWRPGGLDGPGRPARLSACPRCHRRERGRTPARDLLGTAPACEPVMEHGLSLRPGCCPKCRGLLAQEPGYARCRWGCGKLWPILGASRVRQFEYELRSGLLLSA